MAKFGCLAILFGKTKEKSNAFPAKTEYTAKAIETNDMNSLCLSITVSQVKQCFVSNVNIVNYESHVKIETNDSVYQEEEDKQEDFWIDTDFSEAVSENESGQIGHVSKPGIGELDIFASKKLNHLYSSTRLSSSNRKTASDSQSFEKARVSDGCSNDDRVVSHKMSHANAFIKSLRSSSTVAHISEVSLEVIPTLSPFSSLKCVNLSRNSIAHINPGSLPKGLRTLDLSHNKITTIKDLRELTYLKVVNLSYNRIARIGQGFSSCTLLKEINLAENKISNVEGLHRLSKLTVLDLSFNKITTHDLHKLVVNDKLLVLNLLGNPVQKNVTDKRLSKMVHVLLPKLIYLNKQPIERMSARQVHLDSVVRAAVKGNSRSPRRRAVKRTKYIAQR